jgi:hypothetical protein
MWGHGPRTHERPPRRLAPILEGLDVRVMPTGGAVGPHLGPFQAPATTIPRVFTPPTIVDPHDEINQFLSGQLGSGVNSIQQQAELLGSSETNLVANQVASQTFIHSVLSRLDTYTLLGQSVSATGGSLSGVYSATGPIVVNALQTGSSHAGPNAPRRVPGLRLVTGLADNHNFPNSHSATLLYELRVAVARSVFTLSDTQASLVSQGFAQFLNTVNTLNQEGEFTPAVPPAAPALPRGPLYGTLFVSLGALRNLTSVAPALEGLQLPVVGDFVGRIDVGFVIDRQGNFGIGLTARGPLLGAPKGVVSANAIAGDIRIQVSNARNLNELNGLTTVEGITQGAALSGAIETSRLSNGVATFGTSIGYGSGLEFGTGMAYTQVIPLGNLYALIPEYPKQS